MVILAVAGFLMVQFSLKGFRKIPFACSYLPGKANLHVKLGLFAIGFLFITSQAIELEYWSLSNTKTYVILLAVLLAMCAWAYRRNVSATMPKSCSTRSRRPTSKRSICAIAARAAASPRSCRRPKFRARRSRWNRSSPAKGFAHLLFGVTPTDADHLACGDRAADRGLAGRLLAAGAPRREGRPHAGSPPGLTYLPSFSASAASTSSLCFMGLTLVHTCTICRWDRSGKYCGWPRRWAIASRTRRPLSYRCRRAA
jgi:hypothetical protein